MFSTKLNAALLAIAFTVGAGVAQATTITFDGLPASSAFLPVGSGFATGGYQLDVTGGLVWILPPRSAGGYATNGTNSLDLGGTVTLTNSANRLFSLTSLDLASVAAPQTSVVRLTGANANGSSIIQTYTIGGGSGPHPLDLTTYRPTGFNNLTSLVMELVYSPTDATWFSLVDNLVLNEQAVSAVPEPETWAMLGLGLAMVAGMSRRKRA